MAASDKDVYDALMTVTRELSRVATLLETLVKNDSDKEARLRKVENWIARLPATLFTAVAGAAGTVYMAVSKLTGKG